MLPYVYGSINLIKFLKKIKKYFKWLISYKRTSRTTHTYPRNSSTDTEAKEVNEHKEAHPSQIYLSRS